MKSYKNILYKNVSFDIVQNYDGVIVIIKQ